MLPQSVWGNYAYICLWVCCFSLSVGTMLWFFYENITYICIMKTENIILDCRWQYLVLYIFALSVGILFQSLFGCVCLCARLWVCVCVCVCETKHCWYCIGFSCTQTHTRTETHTYTDLRTQTHVYIYVCVCETKHCWYRVISIGYHVMLYWNTE